MMLQFFRIVVGYAFGLVRMPTGEVETSYINCVGPSHDKPSSNSEPNVLIDNPRTNKQSHVGEVVSESPKKDFVKMSKRIPYWLWYLIAKALGLKLKPSDKPICAIILYLLTVLSALGYIIASIWYYVFYVTANHKGRSGQMEGTVTILMTTLWCALGVYANKLAYRLFGNIKFLDMLRLHSKTVFKLNAAFVVFFLWTAFIVLLNLGTLKFWHGEPCDKVKLDRLVCQVRYMCQVVFSVFALLWNILVAVVLVSVCRTHTTSIRRFIAELEQDAIAVDPRDDTARELAKEYALVEDEDMDYLTEDSDAEMRTTRGRNRVGDSNHTLSTVVADSMGVSVASRSETPNPAVGINTPIILSNADILHQYWNLMVKLRISSLALQRWMISVMSMIIVWAAMNLVHWLSHDPKLYDVLNFMIPLLLLPLLCSAYSEVNNEGLRVAKLRPSFNVRGIILLQAYGWQMPKYATEWISEFLQPLRVQLIALFTIARWERMSVKPLQGRLELLMYLTTYPVQMTVFNYPIAYSTIGTVVAGFLLALISKMLMQDLVL